MANTIPTEMRQRILEAYDQGTGTRAEVAGRFGVSEDFVKKLLKQRKATGDIAPRHRYSGRKPTITPKHEELFRKLIEKDPGLTLEQIRDGAGLDCTIQAVHRALVGMGMTFKKRRSMQPSRTARMSSKPVRDGRNG